jgi:hypothetical protein
MTHIPAVHKRMMIDLTDMMRRSVIAPVCAATNKRLGYKAIFDIDEKINGSIGVMALVGIRHIVERSVTIKGMIGDLQ